MSDTFSISTLGPLHHAMGYNSMLESLEGGVLRAVGNSFRENLFNSGYYYPPHIENVLVELCDIAETHGQPNWDGEGAVAIDALTIQQAINFVLALPLNCKMPECAAHTDGEVSLSWIGIMGHRLSLSIGKTGRVSYAYRKGARRKNGTEWFTGQTPEDVLEYIQTFPITF